MKNIIFSFDRITIVRYNPYTGEVVNSKSEDVEEQFRIKKTLLDIDEERTYCKLEWMPNLPPCNMMVSRTIDSYTFHPICDAIIKYIKVYDDGEVEVSAIFKEENIIQLVTFMGRAENYNDDE